MTVSASLHASLRDAAKAVAEVARGRSLSAVLERAGAAGVAPDSPRAALIDLAHGTLRSYGRVHAITRSLARKGGTTDPLVEALLWCAIYAAGSGRYAPYTVVDQAVHAATDLGRAQAKGYVNAMLRRFLREQPQLEARLADEPETRWQHPGWWIDAVRAAWPDHWQGILAAANSPPPMTLRVNARRGTTDTYLARLAEAGIAGRVIGDEAILLERAVPVDRLPGFGDGDVSVQDAGAQRAAHCLDARDGMRVLDACSAPGGKCAQVLESADVDLTALDLDARRCALVESNLSRLALKARVVSADCTRLDAWWDSKPFDRVLADVPCSASGVARRHPDMKWLRRQGDLGAFARRQSSILDALWQVLAPDGKLLYVTCSVFPEENNAVVDAFCQRTPGALKLALPDGAPAQSLPGPAQDGFYYALLGHGG